MGGAQDRDAKTDASGLYDKFRELLEDGRYDQLVHAILLHPYSLAKLKSAACSVLRSKASQENNLLDELTQAAIALLSERFFAGQIPYCDQGPDKFEGWLWTVWHNACSLARRRQLTVSEQHRIEIEMDFFMEIESSDTPDDRWLDVRNAIASLPDFTQRAVMLDWAAGFNGIESAGHLALSITSIYRHRKAAVKIIRQRMEIDSPRDSID